MEAYRVFFGLLDSLAQDPDHYAFVAECIEILAHATPDECAALTLDDGLYNMFHELVESATQGSPVATVAVRQAAMWITADVVACLWLANGEWQTRLRDLATEGGLDFYTRKVLPRLRTW